MKRKNENLKYESKEKKPNTLTPSSLGKPVSKPKKPSAILVLKLEQLMSYDWKSADTKPNNYNNSSFLK